MPKSSLIPLPFFNNLDDVSSREKEAAETYNHNQLNASANKEFIQTFGEFLLFLLRNEIANSDKLENPYNNGLIKTLFYSYISQLDPHQFQELSSFFHANKSINLQLVEHEKHLSGKVDLVLRFTSTPTTKISLGKNAKTLILELKEIKNLILEFVKGIIIKANEISTTNQSDFTIKIEAIKFSMAGNLRQEVMYVARVALASPVFYKVFRDEFYNAKAEFAHNVKHIILANLEEIKKNNSAKNPYCELILSSSINYFLQETSPFKQREEVRTVLETYFTSLSTEELKTTLELFNKRHLYFFRHLIRFFPRTKLTALQTEYFDLKALLQPAIQENDKESQLINQIFHNLFAPLISHLYDENCDEYPIICENIYAIYEKYNDDNATQTLMRELLSQLANRSAIFCEYINSLGETHKLKVLFGEKPVAPTAEEPQVDSTMNEFDTFIEALLKMAPPPIEKIIKILEQVESFGSKLEELSGNSNDQNTPSPNG